MTANLRHLPSLDSQEVGTYLKLAQCSLQLHNIRNSGLVSTAEGGGEGWWFGHPAMYNVRYVESEERSWSFEGDVEQKIVWSQSLLLGLLRAQETDIIVSNTREAMKNSMDK